MWRETTPEERPPRNHDMTTISVWDEKNLYISEPEIFWQAGRHTKLNYTFDLTLSLDSCHNSLANSSEALQQHSAWTITPKLRQARLCFHTKGQHRNNKKLVKIVQVPRRIRESKQGRVLTKQHTSTKYQTPTRARRRGSRKQWHAR